MADTLSTEQAQPDGVVERRRVAQNVSLPMGSRCPIARGGNVGDPRGLSVLGEQLESLISHSPERGDRQCHNGDDTPSTERPRRWLDPFSIIHMDHRQRETTGRPNQRSFRVAVTDSRDGLLAKRYNDAGTSGMATNDRCSGGICGRVRSQQRHPGLRRGEPVVTRSSLSRAYATISS
jgi:hypothetical protein